MRNIRQNVYKLYWVLRGFFDGYVVGLPHIICTSITRILFEPKVFGGVQVLDGIAMHQSTFNEVVTDSLEFLAASDPRRFRRVQREIKLVLHIPSRTKVATYVRPLKLCHLDLELILPLQPKEAIGIVASILVHEATHGACSSKGVCANPRNIRRIERLCYLEQNRFLIRVGMDPIPWDEIEGHIRWRFLTSRIWEIGGEVRNALGRDFDMEAAAWSDRTANQNRGGGKPNLRDEDEATKTWRRRSGWWARNWRKRIWRR
jgi:hypothetical protein